MFDAVLHNQLDRRLRVMLRFTDFCIARMRFLSRLARGCNSGEGDWQIQAIDAASRIAIIALALLRYIERPFPARSARRSILSDHHTQRNAGCSNDVSRMCEGENTPAVHPASESVFGSMATKLCRKGRALIKLDRSYRFEATAEPCGDKKSSIEICKAGAMELKITRSPEQGCIDPPTDPSATSVCEKLPP